MAGRTLDAQLDMARKRADLAQMKLDTVQRNEAYKFFKNKNIKQSRLRTRTSTTPGPAEKDHDTSDRLECMASSRQLVEENPLAAAILQRTTDLIVGTGFVLDMLTPDKDFNKVVEDRWRIDRDKMDIRGVRTWGPLQRLWYDRRYVDGDVGLNMVAREQAMIDETGKPTGEIVHRSQVQTIEADRIFKDKVKTAGDTGIDFDVNGAPKVYWVGQYASKTSSQRKDRSQAFLAETFALYANYAGNRAEAQRGFSMMLQATNAIKDIEQIMEAMGIKAKNEAFIGMAFKTDLPESGSLFGTEIQEDRTAEDGKARSHVRMATGMNLNLSPGEDVLLLESKSPHGNWVEYIRFMMRYVGAVSGLPLELVLLDVSQTNFSGGRILIELAKRRFSVEQDGLGAVSSRIFQWWLAREIKHNGLVVPAGIDLPWAHQWIKPGFPYINPQQEMQANILRLSTGLTTRTRLLAEAGESVDLDSIIAELGREQEAMAGANVPVLLGMPGQEQVSDDSDAAASALALERLPLAIQNLSLAQTREVEAENPPLANKIANKIDKLVDRIVIDAIDEGDDND